MSRQQDQFATIHTDDIGQVVKDTWRLAHEYQFYGCPAFFGPPGTGKTHSIIRAGKEIAAEHGWEFTLNNPNPGDDEFSVIVWQMANSSEEVVSGLPWPDKETNTQLRAMVSSLPRSGRGILYLDEMLQAPYTQRFAAQLAYDRRLDDYYYLPEGYIVVMSSNSARDRAGVSRMWSHFQNRIQSFWVTPTVEGALRNFKHPATPEVSVFLKFNPGSLYKFDPKKDGPFPTARTWDFCNTLCHAGLNPISHFSHFQGYIGQMEASSFRATYQAVSKLPNLEELFEDPDAHSTRIRGWYQGDPSVLTAIAFVALRKLDQYRDIKFAARAIKIFEHAGVEMAAAYVAVAKSIDLKHDDGESMLDTKEYADFLVRNAKVLAN